MENLRPKEIEMLTQVSTATYTTVLLKMGLRNVWIRHAKPLVSDCRRIAGRAFTVRFVPAREDLATPASWASPISSRGAIEQMPSGCIAVVDAMGVTDAGVWGDILCERMVYRGVAGMVTDGAVRDLAGVQGTGLPIWAAGTAASPSVASLTFADWQLPVACGGVAVIPGDVIVADMDGAVVIPAALLDEVLELGLEQERLEGWMMQEVGRGVALPGLYPPNEATRERYEAFKAWQ
ncbi:ribonuclease activity regulator RraA [Pseudomonas sp. CCC3.1]|uniref:ribonuclease activity regulator RraA n=1 Tax=Pseudomonas sp. CCC3.1 TaxID=3048607 RepID=UPI002AC92A93|nr:ribonuclease activity regulator RraA [Pseudomonas sp. CCC3.1]MEB0204275.1 ribonuclease activity regulator RraA [Pseudomonas sp. CCC3.1]WPX34318.1 ribonuclease activity regulator RraA [Pseudomonas sp. CCC3.1]